MRTKCAHFGSLFFPTITITVIATNIGSRGVVSTINGKAVGLDEKDLGLEGLREELMDPEVPDPV